jgi:hypothetical protein
MGIIPECYIDTNLVETIVPPERIGNICGYNHQLSCNKVVDEMLNKLKDDFAVGIVDYDKRKLERTAQFESIIEKQLSKSQFLKLYKHPNKHHYLIFHPPIEQWILDEAQRVGIQLDDVTYNLPTTLKELTYETKVKVKSKNDPRFKKLFRDLKSHNAVGIKLLAEWISYLKQHPYNANINELKNLS